MKHVLMASALLVGAVASGAGAQDEGPIDEVRAASLVEALTAENATARESAADELARLGPRAAPAAAGLVDLLGHEELAVRVYAYEGLAHLGAGAAPVLLGELAALRALPEAGPKLAWVAGAIWEVGQDMLPTVEPLLTAEDAGRRALGIEALGYCARDVKTIGKTLLAFLKAEGIERTAAIEAAGRIGDGAERCLPLLTKMVKDRDDPDRLTAARSIRSILLDHACTADTPSLPSGRLRDAVTEAGRWLVAHQEPGPLARWSAAEFGKRCTEEGACGSFGESDYNVGVTGLALLALMPAAGDMRVTSESAEISRAVRRGLMYLVAVQDTEGCLGGRSSPHYNYNVAIGAQALCEALGRTRNPLWRGPAETTLRFIEAARSAGAGWRYGIRDGTSDTSVTGWMVSALKMGELAGISVDRYAYEGAMGWVAEMTATKNGRTGYMNAGGSPARTTDMMDRFPSDKSESLTAIALHLRVLTGRTPGNDEMSAKGVGLCLAKAPRWEPGWTDQYFWMAGSLALYRIGGSAWPRWRTAVEGALLPAQRAGGGFCASGSWEAPGPWGPEGGRVYSTAAMLLCLECVTGRVRRFPKPGFTRSTHRTALRELGRVAEDEKETDLAVRELCRAAVDASVEFADE